MKCKKGDLAFIKCASDGFENTLDKVVQCVERRDIHGFPGWQLDRRLHSDDGTRSFDCITDCCLKPINPGDDQDEMLRLAGLPPPAKVIPIAPLVPEKVS